MILANNATYLQKEHLNIWTFLNNSLKKWSSDSITPIITKSGLPSLLIEERGSHFYLHSKYDPIKEAEQWCRSYEEQMEQFNHIFFYGIGFAYHIEYLMNKYPTKYFTLYEPNPIIFYTYLCHRKLSDLPLNRLQHLYIEDASVDIDDFFRNFLRFTEEFLIIPHPVYERVFERDTKHFLTLFRQFLYDKRTNLLFISNTEHLWTLNATNNFIKVLETPNILREKAGFLKGKPVLLVSAGPSLAEELENILNIKEQGLAYIFAVGSSNKALLNYGIEPDAMTTYDPYDHNFLVFENIINKNITSIPLIFGTSVGYKTTASYPGPMMHMITSIDCISDYYLRNENIVEKNEVIPDVPSIAIMTLDLLHRLGCDLVILIGQNFAFKNNEYYSKGIHDIYHADNEPTAGEISEMENVVSVDGKLIITMKAFNQARLEMERFLQTRTRDSFKVINTTKGGALIDGAPFMELSQVTTELLQQPVVDKDWFKVEKTLYNKNHINNQAIAIQKDYDLLPELFNEIKKTLNNLKRLSKYKNKSQLDKINKQFKHQMKLLVNNAFYVTFIKVELFRQTEALELAMNSVINLNEFENILNIVLDKQIWYINEVEQIFEKRKDIFIQFQKSIFEQID
jgi:hypothetical protein